MCFAVAPKTSPGVTKRTHPCAYGTAGNRSNLKTGCTMKPRSAICATGRISASRGRFPSNLAKAELAELLVAGAAVGGAGAVGAPVLGSAFCPVAAVVGVPLAFSLPRRGPSSLLYGRRKRDQQWWWPKREDNRKDECDEEPRAATLAGNDHSNWYIELSSRFVKRNLESATKFC